jgi:DNA-binding IclR family transcriptional regulator
VLDATGRPVAALNVTGRSAEFEGAARREQIARALAAGAEELSRRLGWHPRAGTLEQVA